MLMMLHSLRLHGDWPTNRLLLVIKGYVHPKLIFVCCHPADGKSDEVSSNNFWCLKQILKEFIVVLWLWFLLFCPINHITASDIDPVARRRVQNLSLGNTTGPLWCRTISFTSDALNTDNTPTFYVRSRLLHAGLCGITQQKKQSQSTFFHRVTSNLIPSE